MVQRHLAEGQLTLIYEFNAQFDSIAFVIACPGDRERFTEAYPVGQPVVFDTGHVLFDALEPLRQRGRHDHLVTVGQLPMVRHSQAIGNSSF